MSEGYTCKPTIGILTKEVESYEANIAAIDRAIGNLGLCVGGRVSLYVEVPESGGPRVGVPIHQAERILAAERARLWTAAEAAGGRLANMLADRYGPAPSARGSAHEEPEALGLARHMRTATTAEAPEVPRG